MQFAHPENLWLLVLVGLMAAALVLYAVWRGRVMRRVGHLSLVEKMADGSTFGVRMTQGVLVVVAAALLCLATAQPQWGQDDRTIKRMGVDVVYALDLSKSMLAQDVPPHRLAAAKGEIAQSLEALSGDRVGLVVFTAVSFAQSPLTTDYGAIRFYLDKLDPKQMPVGGTALGRAIHDATELLIGRKLDGSAEEAEPAAAAPVDALDRADNQIIVLITDGEDHESDPVASAKLAREHGIRIVTVGIGSTDGSRIPIYGDNGELRGYKRDRKGDLVYTKLDTATLERIAEITGGTTLRYTGENSVVNGLTDYIDKLEKSEIETMLRERYKDRFTYFLAPALLLLLLAMAMGERWPGRRQRPGRTITKIGLLVGLVVLVGLGGCDDAFRDTQGSVDEGNAAVAQGDYTAALEAYQRAETEIPARPELHYNLGIAHLGEAESADEAASHLDQAREAFARALATNQPMLRFDALYNLGLALAGQEQWQEAYESYQQALMVDLPPAVREREDVQARLAQARHNLEVIWRKIYPPCAELDDDHEDNDRPADATPLEEMTLEDAALCGLDEDWYRVPVMPGTTVSLEATFTELRDEPDPEAAFLPRASDVQLAVFDPQGQEAIAVDQGIEAPADEAADRSVTRTISKFTVTPDMLPSGAQTLLIQLKAADRLEFAYDLAIKAVPPCQALQEDAEPNDSAEQATPTGPGSKQLHICPGDRDVLSVDVELGDTLFVDLKAKPDPERETPPALALELVRADTGQVVARGRQEAGFVTAGVQNVVDPGEFYVRVRGATDHAQGPYEATIYRYAPCVVGDDRHEPNDSARAAAELDPNERIHRYLRTCPDDLDFFRVGIGDDKKLGWGLSQVDAGEAAGAGKGSDSGSFAAAGDDAPLEFSALSASGDQVLAEAKPVVQQAPAANPAAPDGATAGLKLDLAFQLDDVDEEAALLRVAGPPRFYHLVQTSGQNQQPDDKKKDDQEQKDQEDPQKQDEQKDGEKKDGEKQDEEKKDGEKKDGEKQDEEKKDGEKEDGEKRDGEQKDEQARQDEEAAEQARRAAEEREKRRIEDVLEALEETDDNFQMKKALEDMPGRYIEKDW